MHTYQHKLFDMYAFKLTCCALVFVFKIETNLLEIHKALPRHLLN